MRERLNRFVGEWNLEASFVQPAATGRAVFEWVLDGQFMTERAEILGAPGSIAVVGLDTNGQAYTQHYFDARGVARIYSMTSDGGIYFSERLHGNCLLRHGVSK